LIDATYEEFCDKREHYSWTNIYEHNENIKCAISIYHNYCMFNYKVSSLLEIPLLLSNTVFKHSV
jgi:hypothetical protein